MKKIVDLLFYLITGCSNHEKNLIRYQGYRHNSILRWKRQSDLNWFTVRKLLNKIEMFDGQRIRQSISVLVEKNKEIFSGNNFYITSFGSEGKSGGKIVYEFRHSKLIKESKFKSSWELARLPSNSKIIFTDDLIGTGSQSVKFINEKLNLALNPSHIPYLFTICATSEGINNVTNNTNFKVLNGIELTEDLYQHYTDVCHYFNPTEKNKLIQLNNLLKDKNAFDYDRGLLIVFYYSVPNNSMPILWKDGYKYVDENGNKKIWYALLPRQF